LAHALVGPGAEDGRMLARYARRGFARVVVQRKRLPDDAVGTADRTYAVVAAFVRGKEHTTPKRGRIGALTASDVSVPQLDVTAPGRIPVFVEVQKQVDPAVEIAEAVEVDMDVEATASRRHVHTAPL